MAKVFGLHELELKPGVTAEEFERFFRDVVMKAPLYPGWSFRLLKGDRGEREGKYALLFEIESVEMRDRFSPAPNRSSDEARRHTETHKAIYDQIFEQWDRLASAVGERFTDYVVVVE